MTVTSELTAFRAQVEERHRARTPGSRALHEQALRYLPGGNTRTAVHYQPYPVYMERGEGCRLFDVDGNEYLDFVNNYTALVHGHNHPHILEAVTRQLAKGTIHGTPAECQIELARVLCERVPSVESVRFCNSGTEATLQAIRAAKAYTGRNKVLKMEGGYHGTHDAADISTGPPLAKAGPIEAPHSVPWSEGLFRGVIEDVVVAPFNDIEHTAGIIERHADDLAAVIVEPVLGAAMIPARTEYLEFLRDATRDSGAILIFDEVVTLRMATGGAQEYYGVTPDLTTMGKVIGGGFPAGAFGGRGDIMALFDTRNIKVYHSGTFNGNNVTMVAGLASLELLTPEAIDRLNALGERLRRGLQAVFDGSGMAGQVTGIASMANYHFTDEPVTDYRAARRAREAAINPTHLAMLNRGIFVANRDLLCLSTVMGEDEVDAAVAAFAEVIRELEVAALA